MDRRTTRFDVEEFAKRIALGHGQGIGRSYTPCLRLGDIPSSVASPQADPTLLSFSDFKRLIAEYVATYNDAREQGPIDRKLT
jgi:hypothetical protein